MSDSDQIIHAPRSSSHTEVEQLAYVQSFDAVVDKDYAFVRWHGRQALLLAAARTAVPIVLGVLVGEYGLLFSIPVLLAIWCGGTLWGQLQAKDGKCTLMQRSGQEALPARTEAGEDMQVRMGEKTQALIEIVRFSRDPEERKRAIAELSRRGMVEAL